MPLKVYVALCLYTSVLVGTTPVPLTAADEPDPANIAFAVCIVPPLVLISSTPEVADTEPTPTEPILSSTKGVEEAYNASNKPSTDALK